MAKRKIILECDDADYDTIQAEFARQQQFRDKDGTLLPDGDSNLSGAMVAEAIRNLEEYRQLWESQNPPAKETP